MGISAFNCTFPMDTLFPRKESFPEINDRFFFPWRLANCSILPRFIKMKLIEMAPKTELFLGTMVHCYSDKNEIQQISTTLREEFRILRIAAKEIKNTRSEQVYYRLEQTCHFFSGEMGFMERFFSKWYRRLSNYGQSLIRPFGILLGAMFFPSVLYAALCMVDFSSLTNFSFLLDCFETSVNQAFKPFKLVTANNPELFLDIPVWKKVTALLIGGIQSILIISTTPLFLLALRGHFSRNLN